MKDHSFHNAQVPHPSRPIEICQARRESRGWQEYSGPDLDSWMKVGKELDKSTQQVQDIKMVSDIKSATRKPIPPLFTGG
jgi:hypothetical protein